MIQFPTSFHRYTTDQKWKARGLRNYDAIIVAPRALNYTALAAQAYVAKRVTLRRLWEYLLERRGEGEGRGSHHGDGSKRQDIILTRWVVLITGRVVYV